MKMILSFAILGSIFSCTSFAEETQRFACAPSLSCPFTYMEIQSSGGVKYLKARLDENEVDFLAEFTSPTQAEGSVAISYGSTVCSFPISVRLEKVASGYKVVTKIPPIPDAIRLGRCPTEGAPVLKIHEHVYLSSEFINKFIHIDLLSLLDPKNRDVNKAVAGTWRFDQRYMNNCNATNDTHDFALDMVHFNCASGEGPIAQVNRRLIPRATYPDSCFYADPKKPMNPFTVIRFKTVEDCQNAIKTLRHNYDTQPCNPGLCVSPIYVHEWSAIFLKSTGAFLTQEQLSSGKF